MKICSTCKQELPVSMFYKSKQKGHQTYCKPCANKRRTEWARNNRDKTRNYRLKYLYGLSTDQFNTLMKQQNYSCGLCKRKFDEKSTIHVDHDHSCCSDQVTCGACVRGLLHARCNVIVGYFESESMQKSIIEYLQQSSQALK